MVRRYSECPTRVYNIPMMESPSANINNLYHWEIRVRLTRRPAARMCQPGVDLDPTHSVAQPFPLKP
jgi:hypothetical protein